MFMKKKFICLAAAVLLAQQSFVALGALNSSNTAGAVVSGHDRDDSKATSKPLDLDSVGAKGSASNQASTTNYGVSISGSAQASGSSETGSTSGAYAGSNNTYGNSNGVTFRFASDEETKDALPWYAAETVFTINSGTTPLYRATGQPDLVGYNPLIPVQTLVVEGASVDPNAVYGVSVYVPNLVEGLGNVEMYYFNIDTKQWEKFVPVIDYATKNVYVALKPGTPFTVIYK